MATLDDKILGEKLHYYCSSSEDEEDRDEDEGRKAPEKSSQPQSGPPPPTRPWDGNSANTGPKGVLEDWRQFKQMETEKRKEKETEKMQLAKKLAFTCRSHLDDEKEKEAQRKAEEEADELELYLDDSIIQQYIAQRMQELSFTNNSQKVFGKVTQLSSSEQFINAIDNEDKKVTVIIHISRKGAVGCEAVSGCFLSLAKDFPSVKFCEISVYEAALSAKFVQGGVPALLVYRGGNLIANFVRLTDSLGEDFYAQDLESFLVEHGALEDKSLCPASRIRERSDESDED